MGNMTFNIGDYDDIALKIQAVREFIINLRIKTKIEWKLTVGLIMRDLSFMASGKCLTDLGLYYQ